MKKHAPAWEEFFDFAVERELIRIKKEAGESPPWTEDPVLSTYRFCNVYREDDKTTRWFRRTVRDPQQDDENVLFATVAFRWFNRIGTGEVLLPYLRPGKWDPFAAKEDLMRLQALGPVVTGAYVIKTPDNYPKIVGILNCLQHFRRNHERRVLGCMRNEGSLNAPLERIHEALLPTPFLGPFMAYEIVSDLRHTKFCASSPDIWSWASAGPGAARGLGWLFRGTPDAFGYTSANKQGECLWHMREVLAESAVRWPPDWRPWEMREVEHVLCEYDKWMRGTRGGRLKRLYRC